MQFQPGHHHDGHRSGGQGVHGAFDPGVHGKDRAVWAAGRHPAVYGRTDRAESGGAAGEKRGFEGVPGKTSGDEKRQYRAGWGPGAV